MYRAPRAAASANADSRAARRGARPNITTVIVQPTPYDKNETECLAFTDCFETAPGCTRNCTFEATTGNNCRCWGELCVQLT